ncbi:MAG: Gldg family protein [Gammaproteobacteria bacterium]|nr:Gldg family protein [Gammaproteobacteria bacterium]
MKYKRLLSGSGILLAAVLAVALITIGNNLFTGVRLDLTENKLFTLSPGSINIITGLDEPISLDFYVSRKTMADFPQLVNYANRVRDLLEEYAAKSGGNIELSVIEPEPFSEEEDQAVASGLNGIAVNAAGDRAYLGLVGVNSTDDEATIPFFQASREDALEYDITKLIYNLANPEKRVIGVMTGLTLFGDPAQGIRERWAIIDVMEEFFEVRNIGADTDYIDEDVDVLMVVHPKNFAEEALFAIDQYLLRGGHAMLFVDPLAEGDNAEPDPANPYVMPDMSSNLNIMLEGWGLEVGTGEIAADINLAMRVQTQGARGPQESNYLPWLRLEADNLDRQDFSTSELNLIHMGTAGVIDLKEDANIEFAPLIRTTADSMRMQRDLIFFQRDPNVMLSNFESGNTPLVLAARISGTVPSAYPEGVLIEDEEEEAAPVEDIVKEGRVDVILVGDTDILADHFWMRTQNFFGVQIPQSIANNGDFVINTLENLAGSTDLISLRSRGEFSRPFTVVEQIRRDAEARFRAQEQELQARLQETEQKIAQLQQEGGEGALLLSQEQAAEIEKFRLEQIRTRKELRAVQHELQKNIERLGTQLKFINIGLIPLIIALLAVVAGMQRARRKA